MSLTDTLAALGFSLPPPPAAVGNFVGARRSGSLIVVSGQLPLREGRPVCVGRVGSAISLETAYEAARVAALNALAQAAFVAGSLDALKGVVRVGGFVQADSDFFDVPKVVNGASDFYVSLFGDAGRHARAAIGVMTLPANVPVEIEATFEI
ncbi:MAG: RidA family protein [Burkholderiales bacterium]|jgi:enamine deaminase RidA (YjgF/YER057c/UK114 family)|nr:RidA family protein [Burkholderiales bacterium]